jgi:repressor LexA
MRHREMGVRLIKFLYEYKEENGFPPSVREICAELGYTSSSSGKTLLEITQKRGWIQVNTKIPRGIKILDEGMAVIQEEIQEIE